MTSRTGHVNETSFSARMRSESYRAIYYQTSMREDFLAAIEAEMERRKISRSDLAKLLDTTPAAITNMFRQDHNYTIGRIGVLAAVLGLRPTLTFKREKNGDPR